MSIVVILGGVTLPTPDLPFKRITTPNETDNTTLDGTIYTDFINRRRSWSMTWGALSETEYDAIRAIYNAQYTNQQYPILQIAHYSLVAAVKMNVTPEDDIRRDGTCIRGFGITLLEQYAVS
jgi:hypothetical protein